MRQSSARRDTGILIQIVAGFSPRSPRYSRLYWKALTILVRHAKRYGIALRQSHTRLAKAAMVRAGRHAHARQLRRMRRALRQLRTYLGRVYRDVGRKIAGNTALEGKFARLLGLVERLLAQQPKDKDKLYALHAPEVVCIAKSLPRRRPGARSATSWSIRWAWCCTRW